MNKKLMTLAFLVSVGNMTAVQSDSPPVSLRGNSIIVEVGATYVITKGHLYSPGSERKVKITGTSEGRTLDQVLEEDKADFLHTPEFQAYLHSRGRRLQGSKQLVYHSKNLLDSEEFLMARTNKNSEILYLHATYLEPATDQ